MRYRAPHEPEMPETCPVCGAVPSPRDNLIPFCSEACENVYRREQEAKDEALAECLRRF